MKILSIAVLALIVSFSAIAFSKGHGGHYNASPEQKVERMTSRLALDDAQQQQILEVFTATQQERENLQQLMLALREQTRERISEVLNDEQLAMFAKPGWGQRGGKCKGSAMTE